MIGCVAHVVQPILILIFNFILAGDVFRAPAAFLLGRNGGELKGGWGRGRAEKRGLGSHLEAGVEYGWHGADCTVQHVTEGIVCYPTGCHGAMRGYSLEYLAGAGEEG